MKAFLCKLIFSCLGIAEPTVTPLAELTYNNVLFSYYQDDFAQALLDVRVAQQQGLTAGAETKFSLAEGSFAFGAQMFGYAARTFASVDASELTEIDKLRLAFHLSREHFRTGDWQALGGELEKIELGTTRFFGRERFHPEVEFMRAELALQRGDHQFARERVSRLDDSEVYKMYGLFNLGGALRAAGDAAAAEQAFAEIAKKRPTTTEMLDLQQRALLAQAFLQRENGEIEAAEKTLGRLPAEGRYRDLALASFGSLAMESGNYELAARVWMLLAEQPLWTPSTATAKLGFPLSLENLARRDLALTHYRLAETSFAARAVKLDELSRQADDDNWIRGLLTAFAQGDKNSATVQQWQERLGHTDWLQWLSAESVDSLLNQWQELRGMAEWLEVLPSKLSTYAELAVEQRRRAQAVKVTLADGGLLNRHAEISAEIDSQFVAWERLGAQTVAPDFAWMAQFANTNERKRLQRLERMYEFVDTKLDADAQAKWGVRLDRLQGVLFWQLADQQSVRLQQMRTVIRDVEAISAQLSGQTQRLQAAESSYEAGVLTDFAMLDARSGQIGARVQTALLAREQQLAAEIKRGMRRESAQVQQYLLTTRVAIARTLDQYASIDGGQL